jgi:hypothetical protein
MSLSKQAQKRKVSLECSIFNEQWTEKYFFVQNKCKAVYLICKDYVSVVLSAIMMCITKI